jgi:hypothetical protein
MPGSQSPRGRRVNGVSVRRCGKRCGRGVCPRSAHLAMSQVSRLACERPEFLTEAQGMEPSATQPLRVSRLTYNGECGAPTRDVSRFFQRRPNVCPTLRGPSLAQFRLKDARPRYSIRAPTASHVSQRCARPIAWVRCEPRALKGTRAWEAGGEERWTAPRRSRFCQRWSAGGWKTRWFPAPCHETRECYGARGGPLPDGRGSAGTRERWRLEEGTPAGPLTGRKVNRRKRARKSPGLEKPGPGSRCSSA